SLSLHDALPISMVTLPLVMSTEILENSSSTVSIRRFLPPEENMESMFEFLTLSNAFKRTEHLGSVLLVFEFIFNVAVCFVRLVRVDVLLEFADKLIPSLRSTRKIAG